MPKSNGPRSAALGFRHSCFFRHLAFVIRHYFIWRDRFRPHTLSRRMKSSLLLLLTGLFVANASAADFLTFEGKAGPGKGKHVVLLSGDEEYRSEESLPQLAKILS